MKGNNGKVVGKMKIIIEKDKKEKEKKWCGENLKLLLQLEHIIVFVAFLWCREKRIGTTHTASLRVYVIEKRISRTHTASLKVK